MPQDSIAYAVARVRVLERDALDAARIERLLTAATYAEALRTLQEMGWANAESADYERLAARHVERACALLREISPDPAVTDAFLMRHDAHNLKMLLKARCLGQPAAHLSSCGTLPPEMLEHAVAERNYQPLPPALAKTMEALEQTLAVRVDPLVIDAALDRALYERVFESLQKGKHNKTALAYFRMRVDLLNAIMLLRVAAMGRDAAFYRQFLLPGGAVEPSEWLEAFDQPERLPERVARYGRSVAQAVERALHDPAGLPNLERAMDDALLALFVPFRYEPLSLEPVIGYVLAREREASAVRLILAGKANGFPPEAIRERLRALYGQK